MKIADIYQNYYVTPNLAQHMKYVAEVVESLHKIWKGPTLDWDVLNELASLHDIGNIVKFDFDKYPQFLGAEIVNIDYWKSKQQEMIAKYGKDDHQATKKILEEIGLEDWKIQVILGKSFVNTINILNSDNWYLKILAYADMRVLPSGIASLNERIEDVKVRMPKYAGKTDFEELVFASRMLEEQVGSKVQVEGLSIIGR